MASHNLGGGRARSPNNWLLSGRASPSGPFGRTSPSSPRGGGSQSPNEWLQNGRAGNPSTPRAREFQAALHIRSSPVRNPLMLSDTTKSHLIFLTKENVRYRTCLGHVGNASGSRFYVANCMDGFSHCGVVAHAAKTTGLLKFAAQDNAFYNNGGANRDQPTAMKDPFVHVDDVPPEL